VVDDDQNIRQLCATILTRQGFNVIAASDGADAVGWFAKRGDEIRLVITDLQMPDFDGLALARVLGQINPRVRMLAITGLPNADQKLASSPPAVKGVLLKPFTADALVRKVQAVMQPAAEAGATLA
jgi:DNA-binding response OmpR family regulator